MGLDNFTLRLFITVLIFISQSCSPKYLYGNLINKTGKHLWIHTSYYDKNMVPIKSPNGKGNDCGMIGLNAKGSVSGYTKPFDKKTKYEKFEAIEYNKVDSLLISE